MFIVVDLIWLGFIAKDLYRKYLGDFLSPNPNWKAAMIFYVLFIVFLVIFVLLPGVDKQSLTYVMLYGAMFGFITYATYDLTNLATLKNWPIQITIIDLMWGTFLGFSVSTLSYLVFNLIF
jgi:uncharacterized membrane protein